MLATIAIASVTFLPSFFPGAAQSLASRPAVLQPPRTAGPLAFGGGGPFDDLSDVQKLELIERLKDSIQATDEQRLKDSIQATDEQRLAPPPDEFLSPSEAQRVSVFERVSPAVAYIQTSIVQPSGGWNSRRNEVPVGAGSGFVWDEEGHIVTNYHVIAAAAGAQGLPGRGGGRSLPRKVMVSLQGSAGKVEAKVVGVEPDKDIAVLKIDPAAVPLRPLDVATSSELRVGQSVLAIGNPFGLDYTLTQGIVSALDREVQGAGGRPIQGCVQTDAAINPGNSGGPLLDARGRLIGVNTMIYAPNGVGANVGIGFAVPVDTVRRVVNQIIQFGPNARPSIGVSLLDDRQRENYARWANRGRKLEGALISEVVPGSPADAAGLAPCERSYGGVVLGDLITAVDSKAITKNEDLLCALEEAEPDQPLRITVMRGCDPRKVEEVGLTPVARKALYVREGQ